MIRLPHVVLPHRLQQLRHVQFSTVFACYELPELPPGIPADFWEFPDDRRQWPAACQILASLPNLQCVRITIVLMCQYYRHRHPNESNATLLCELLQPLNGIHAADYIVEITEYIETVRERLGPTPFRLVEREKPVCLTPSSLGPTLML